MDLNALMRKKYFKGNKHVIPWFSHMNVPLILIYLMISQKNLNNFGILQHLLLISPFTTNM